MKKGNLLGCAMLVMCQLSLAQVSRDSAYDFLKTTILNGNWEDKEICVSPNLVPENSIITALGIGFDTFAISPNYKTWFFYVDEEPISQWHRKCKYVFINDENNFVVIDMTTPPNYTGMIPLHTITPRFIEADTSSWKKRKKSKNKNVSANDHAVIISGGYCPELNYTHYWNNCSAIYNTLKKVYGYNEDNPLDELRQLLKIPRSETI